jgi:hypothetical protein
MDFTVGMRVRVRNDLVIDKEYGADAFVDGMKEYLGCEATIVDVYTVTMEQDGTPDDGTVLKLDIDRIWQFTPEMVEVI